MENKKTKAQKNQKGKTKQTNKNTKLKETNTKQENVTINKENEASKLLKIVLIVTIIMAIFYGITIVATNKADKTKKEKAIETTAEKAEIQYENIMIGTMLNYSGTYYVLIKNKDDNRLEEYESLVDSIKSNENAPTIYNADLSDGFNKGYLAKEANNPKDTVDGFTVTSTTLVKIVDNKIDAVYDNYDSIKEKLNELM